MSIFGHILLLALGAIIVFFIYKDEKQRFNNGKKGLYVKLRKATCSEQEFVAKLKVSIFKSISIRFVILGVIGFGLFAYITAFDGQRDTSISGFDYLLLWISGSMIAMVNRATTAKWNRF